jgi:ATP-dependent RNA helicase RhlE
MGHTSAELHSDRSLAQRREALDGFKSGKYRVLVATDIAARGIDVTGIAAVVNYDVPENPDDYVHRIGRTGRAGLSGHAITFATPDQGDEVRQIEKLTRIQLPITKLPELPPHRVVPPAPRGSDTGRSFGGHGGGRGGYQGRGDRPRYDHGSRGGHGTARPIARSSAPARHEGPSPSRNRPDDILGEAGSEGGVGFFGPHASGDVKKKAPRMRDFRRKR